MRSLTAIRSRAQTKFTYTVCTAFRNASPKSCRNTLYYKHCHHELKTEHFIGKTDSKSGEQNISKSATATSPARIGISSQRRTRSGTHGNVHVRPAHEPREIRGPGRSTRRIHQKTFPIPNYDSAPVRAFKLRERF